MNKILKTLMAIVAVCVVLPFFSSCREDDRTLVGDKYFVLPQALIGESYENVENHLKQFGLTPQVNKENRQITAQGEVTFPSVNGGTSTTTYDITYYFDQEGKCKYLMNRFSKEADFAFCFESLHRSGFNSENAAANDEKVLVNHGTKTVAMFSRSTENNRPGLSVVLASWDEEVVSWSRISPLKDEASGFWAPLIGRGASVDLMFRFENRMEGHQLDTEHSNIAGGVYSFKTGNAQFPEVRYWFDLKKKMFLEEAAIFVNKDNRPSPESVHQFLLGMGYKLTIKQDQDQNQIYYRPQDESIALVMMNQPKNGGEFKPGIQFFYNVLGDDIFAPESIDFPFPVEKLGEISMEEAIEEYKKMPYFKGIQETEMGTVIQTTSKDFTGILIWTGEGNLADKYTMALVIAEKPTVIQSPLIPIELEKRGYQLYPKFMMPTYLNKEKNKYAQIDTKGDFGMYCVTFQPVDFEY